MRTVTIRQFPMRFSFGLRGRVLAAGVAAAGVVAAGWFLGGAEASPSASPMQQVVAPVTRTLRVYGYPVVSNPFHPAEANRPATAGSDAQVDPLTGRLPEDPPYRDSSGPFDPLSDEAPEMDFVTWNPAWISEQLGDAALRRQWPGLTGIDEVSAGRTFGRAGWTGRRRCGCGTGTSRSTWTRT